jgi:prophage regulatory protein
MQLIRVADVIKMVGISKSTLYARTNPNDPSYDPTFPRRFRLWKNARAAFYVKAAVERWVGDHACQNDGNSQDASCTIEKGE